MSSIDTNQNKQVVKRFIEAMGQGDATIAAQCLCDDAYTLAKGFGHFAGVREHETIVGTIAAFKQLFPEGLNPDFISFTAEAERVVAEFEGRATTFDGQPYNNQYCMVFTLSNGKIKHVHEYFCTKLADQVLWPLVQSAMNPESA